VVFEVTGDKWGLCS